MGLTTSSRRKYVVQKPNNQPRIGGIYWKQAKGWKEKMRNREEWRLVVDEAKAHPGMSVVPSEEEEELDKS
jgi:hypothetical protein